VEVKKLGFDLFNPYPIFELKKMKHNIDITTLENPYVQVIWEDSPENFSQERIKSVKQYFQKKYNTTNVNVITKAKKGEDVDQTIDVSVNIMDKNYLNDLVKKILQSKNQESYFDPVMNIDLMVENKMIAANTEVTPFKRWYIKKIEFSNFLSYGEDQVLDFERLNGINVVESDPPNFGGKTVLSVDLLLFLFFNTTTKTQKAEEIFNRFSDKNKVSVRGEITIDGEDYIIARQLERKKSKSGEWNVKTELEFYKKLPNGDLQNFTGEQRRETEEFIKTSIGDMDDFLMTILTTGSNLEDLLESKPTARGQVLSRFLGLDFLKKKEETAKEIYSQFSKGMMSNVYSSEKLKQDNENYEGEIKNSNKRNKELENSIKEVQGRIEKGTEYRDDLLKSKHQIDKDLIILDPNKLDNDINSTIREKENTQNQIDSIIIVEPSEFYHEDKHDKLKEEITDLRVEIGGLTNKITDVQELVDKYGDGLQCEHCGIKLIDAEITKKKIGELAGFIQQKQEKTDLMRDKSSKEQSFVNLKKQFDEYEKNKLIKEKHEVSLEKINLKIEGLRKTQERYVEAQEKINENNKIEDKIIKAGLKLKELELEKNKHTGELATNKTNIENWGKKIESNNILIETIQKEFEKEKEYKVYLECFGKNGISKLIMKTMMPIINSELQRLLQDSCYFNLEIRINDKNEVEFIMVDNSTGVEKLMTSGSGYEKTIASLALRAVLSKVCSLPKPNIVVFDEVFGKVSNDNLEMVGEFFVKIREYFEKIFVITHNPLVNNWANNIIKISKQDNISKIIGY
jgi:DNA repair exonuclease SbcCD ATPase subunit